MLVSNLLKLGSLFIQYAQRERALRFYAFTLLRFYALRAIDAFVSFKKPSILALQRDKEQRCAFTLLRFTSDRALLFDFGFKVYQIYKNYSFDLRF